MADPNQTPARGNWVCPCNGCKKAAKQERESCEAEIEDLKKRLEEANKIKLFYYNSWHALEKIVIELKDLIEYAGLDESNPPLYNKILDVMYGEKETDEHQDKQD